MPPSNDERGGALSANDGTREKAPWAIGDVEAFPSLGMGVAPRLVAPAPTCRKQPAQQCALQGHDAALYSLKDVPMQGRKVTLEVPKTIDRKR